MKLTQWILRMLKTTILILAIGGAASACSSMSWKEEVLLHDGKKIVVERFYNLGGYPALDSRDRAALDETVTFKPHPTGKEIIWRTDFRDSVPEPNSLNLLLLDVVKDVPYIATYPVGCIAYNKWKRPNPTYIFFKYENEEWKQIPLAEFPAELTRANVIIGRPATSSLKSFYTVKGVDDENYDIHTPEYKTILREPMPKAGAYCPEMVTNGHGDWFSMDTFKGHPSYGACLQFCKRNSFTEQNCLCESNLINKGK